MKSVIFISTYDASRGKGASVAVYGKEKVIQENILSKYLQYSEVDSGYYSKPIEYMSIDEFKEIFNDNDIKTMLENGILNYYPDGVFGYGGYLCKGKNDKYPIFRKEVYLAYGVALDIYGNRK